METARGIVVAADVSDLSMLIKLTEAAGRVEEVKAIKIGFQLALQHSLRTVVSAVKSTAPLRVIYDHQKAGTDIPAMGEKFANLCALADVDEVIIFPHAGPSTMEAFVTACFRASVVPIVGLMMSHARFLRLDGGYITDTAPAQILRHASNLGVESFVLPGNKPQLTRAYVDQLSAVRRVRFYMPGIGTQGGSIAEACAAVAPHNPYPIIGSAIYKDADPYAAMRRFAKQLEAS